MSDAADHRTRVARRIIAVLAVIGLAAVAIVYLPRIASGNYHRAAIERLASDALGRRVSIAGPIELSLLPDPQLRADTITIGSPKGGLITAATLKLDLAPLPLLLGRLRATRLTLRKPDVALPWPLPGGAAAVAPPLWLASLHATIVDGVFRLGSLTFDHVDLSIFTGGPNAVLAASGTLAIDGVPASVTLDIDNTGGAAPAPVQSTIRLDGKAGRMDFKGTLDRASVLRGTLGGTLAGLGGASGTSGPVQFKAGLAADGAVVTLNNIDARVTNPRIGDASHTRGSATIALRPAPLLRLDLTGARWRIGAGQTLLRHIAAVLPIAARLDLTDSRVNPLTVKSIHADLTSDAAGTQVQALAMSLPGAGSLTLARSTPSGGADRVRIAAPDPARTIAALRARYAWLPDWPDGLGALLLAGHLRLGADGAIDLARLEGAIGGKTWPRSRFTGGLMLRPGRRGAAIAADLAFDHLRLTPVALRALRAALLDKTPTIAGPIALRARTFDIVTQTRGAPPLFTGAHLLIDGALRDAASGGGVALSLATLRIGQTLVVGHGARRSDGGIMAARWLITGPDAAATLAAITHGSGGKPPAWFGLPVWHHRFAAALVAAGPMRALHTGLTLHLGAIRAAALPVIDLAGGTATGAVTLHAPNAVAVIRDLGGAGALGARNGLDWPGAGSVSLRASAFLSDDRLGLPDFVLSLGALTTSGSLSLRLGHRPAIAGTIAADTLMIPTPDTVLHLAGAAMAGTLRIALPRITAARIADAQTVVARHVAGSLGVGDAAATLSIDRAEVAGGVLGGDATLTDGPAAGITIKAHLQNADAATLAQDSGIAVPVDAGTLGLTVDLTAQGASPADWRTTLAGHVTALGSALAIRGIDLAAAANALAQALARQPAHPGDAMLRMAVRAALQPGTTVFDTTTLQGAVAGGVMTLDQSSLTGAAGSIGLGGTVDFAHDRLALTAILRPHIDGPIAAPALPIKLSGSLDHPRIAAHRGAAPP
ncbi:AsmA family protein [Acidiphilium sp. PA]|uniref:AsmA family protein n=1 Tax=Acidiphilium sp. PA TaxID=2871705 RepID=UPI002244215F|nr:AsmA family protein [Acidiphilium sp. PA]MCW8305670.1 AsmA family protein [Acidiphilium sp. PA]